MESTALSPSAQNSYMPPLCSSFPRGNWSVCSFATYQERQKNPHECDIHHFKVTAIDPQNIISGLVSVVKTNLTYLWKASCAPATYHDVNELRLQFSANSSSGLNNCSGIFTFSNPPFASAMYIGGPDLESGDQNYTLCEGGRYGVAIPPSEKGDSCQQVGSSFWSMA